MWSGSEYQRQVNNVAQFDCESTLCLLLNYQRGRWPGKSHVACLTIASLISVFKTYPLVVVIFTGIGIFLSLRVLYFLRSL